MQRKWVYCILIISALGVLFIMIARIEIRENEVAIYEGVIRTYQVDYIFPTQESDSFYIGDGYNLRQIDASTKQSRRINVDAVSKKQEIIKFHKVDEDSFYLVFEEHGVLVDSDFKLIREDQLPGYRISDVSFSPDGKIATFGQNDYRIGDGHTFAVELESKNVIKPFAGETHPFFVKSENQLQLVTLRPDYSFGSHQLVIRETSSWKTIKKYRIPGKPESVTKNLKHFPSIIGVTEPKQNSFVVGMKDGRLIQFQISPWSMQYEIELSPAGLSGLCTIDDETVAIGNSIGQVLLVNMKSGFVKQLPKKFYCGDIKSLAYQPQSRTLMANLYGRGYFWKLKEDGLFNMRTGNLR